MDSLNNVMFWREAVTVFCFFLFLWICFWAYSSKRQDEFEEINKLFMSEGDVLKGRVDDE